MIMFPVEHIIVVLPDIFSSKLIISRGCFGLFLRGHYHLFSKLIRIQSVLINKTFKSLL